jgi:hypothetical protein
MKRSRSECGKIWFARTDPQKLELGGVILPKDANNLENSIVYRPNLKILLLTYRMLVNVEVGNDLGSLLFFTR